MKLTDKDADVNPTNRKGLLANQEAFPTDVSRPHNSSEVKWRDNQSQSPHLRITLTENRLGVKLFEILGHLFDFNL